MHRQPPNKEVTLVKFQDSNTDLITEGSNCCMIGSKLKNDFYLFVCNRGDTMQYHGGLRSWELGQAPMLLMFQNPRQAG